MLTLENIQELQKLGKDYWERQLNIEDINYLLQDYLEEDYAFNGFYVIRNNLIEILLGIEYLKQQETKTNESTV